MADNKAIVLNDGLALVCCEFVAVVVVVCRGRWSKKLEKEKEMIASFLSRNGGAQKLTGEQLEFAGAPEPGDGQFGRVAARWLHDAVEEHILTWKVKCGISYNYFARSFA